MSQAISLLKMTDLFPTEKASAAWFVSKRWPEGSRRCPHCGYQDTMEVKDDKPMPFRCRGCWSYFSVRTGTILERSKVSLKKWAWAFYLATTSAKGISSVQLAKYLEVTQKTAWFMLHRLREVLSDPKGMFTGPVEVDEAYIGGIEKNKHYDKKLRLGRGAVGKIPVVGVKDRETNQVCAFVVGTTNRETLHSIIQDTVQAGAEVFTDDFKAYEGMENHRHETVRHSIGEYARYDILTNGIESFWALLKRAYKGTYHWMSQKHLHRYIREFTGRHNIKSLGALDRMVWLVEASVGKRLSYADLIA